MYVYIKLNYCYYRSVVLQTTNDERELRICILFFMEYAKMKRADFIALVPFCVLIKNSFGREKGE